MQVFEGSRAEKIWTGNVEKNQFLYVTERQGLIHGADNRYWDNSLTPIVEDCQVKYVVSMLQDVTERVLNREHMKVKNKQLEAILNSTDDLILIVGKDGD